MRQMAVNLAGVELKKPGHDGIRNLWFRGRVRRDGRSEQARRGCDQGCGKCAVARQSDPAYCGGVRRHDQRDRLTESGV